MKKLCRAEMPPDYYNPISIRKRVPELSVEQSVKLALEFRRQRFYINDIYQVCVCDAIWEGIGKMIHLQVRRRDWQSIHDWRDLQEIKNQLVGPENEGIELYPAESRLVDAANQYHIWVFVDPEIRLPIGFSGRCVTGPEMAQAYGVQQREFNGG